MNRSQAAWGCYENWKSLRHPVRLVKPVPRGFWVGCYRACKGAVALQKAGCPRSRRFCETWEGPPRNVHSSQTAPSRFVYSPFRTEGLHRFYGGNDLHFLTFSCYRRRPLFRNEAYCDLLLKILERVRRRYRVVVLGYVVMPEHVHLLVSEPQRETLSIAIQALKLGFVRGLHCARGESVVAEAPRSRKTGETWGAPISDTPGSSTPGYPERFWQARFYDFNVWTEKKRIEKLRYIHRNPMSRGLVSSPERWRWSGFRWHLWGELGPVRINDADIIVMKIRTPAV
jgi:putative transposase